jgi:hypothetical protein
MPPDMKSCPFEASLAYNEHLRRGYHCLLFSSSTRNQAFTSTHKTLTM